MIEPAAAPQADIAMQQEELFPIREVSRLTGVNPVTLRAWERRYGLIKPTRTDSGHRLYSFADIEAVHKNGGLPFAVIERLAAADGFNSIGLNRRQALWQVRALRDAPPLP
eukprot:gene15056-18389_t